MIAARLPGGRLHLSDGPIDLIIRAEGDGDTAERAYDAAIGRFQGLLAELVAELKLLRRPLGDTLPPFSGPVARRMAEAAWPYRRSFVTPMAAVAGAVAEAVLAAMLAETPLRRAFVNNGGDIALHLATAEHLDIGVVRSLPLAEPEAYVRIAATSPVRGVATSGRHGRSFSLGIADAVTVLATDAPSADVAATMIANAVDIDDPAIIRRAARELDPDSDLVDMKVTVAVGPLSEEKIAVALAAGCSLAEALIAEGRIVGALISLGGEWRSLGVERPALGSEEAAAVTVSAPG
ncbi:hypothetical protein SAMN05444161_0532 [Rhizobiales bacterium GAS191]|nr:hypothetical protein SAMN05444161_0532 [Rhizobiales bacterium GAS191]